MKFREWVRSRSCPVCRSLFGCEHGWALAAAIAGVVVAAAGAGYGAYSSSEASSQQAAYAKRAARMQADAEEAAGKARSDQIAYEASKKQKSFLSRAASAGVNVNDSPSLLEGETQFAADTSYAQQLAKYPHQLAGWSDKYQSDLFGFQSKQYGSRAYTNAGIAGGSTLASGFGKAFGKSGSNLDLIGDS